MRKSVVIAATGMIASFIAVWSFYAATTTAPAKAMASTTSLGILQMMRDAKDLPAGRYDACACAF